MVSCVYSFMRPFLIRSFPVLISGSYDRTVRVWNMDTGEQLHCLRGHHLPVRALQFDEVKLITGSMDCTLKVWDWRKEIASER
jgi:F-box/WD-40 domain protein MET30